jgi:hypothetical protein
MSMQRLINTIIVGGFQANTLKQTSRQRLSQQVSTATNTCMLHFTVTA